MVFEGTGEPRLTGFQLFLIFIIWVSIIRGSTVYYNKVVRNIDWLCFKQNATLLNKIRAVTGSSFPP